MLFVEKATLYLFSSTHFSFKGGWQRLSILKKWFVRGDTGWKVIEFQRFIFLKISCETVKGRTFTICTDYIWDFSKDFSLVVEVILASGCSAFSINSKPNVFSTLEEMINWNLHVCNRVHESFIIIFTFLLFHLNEIINFE